MDQFVLKAPYSASGDQPQAIEALAAGIRAGMKNQILLGVTGSAFGTWERGEVVAQWDRLEKVGCRKPVCAA